MENLRKTAICAGKALPFCSLQHCPFERPRSEVPVYVYMYIFFPVCFPVVLTQLCLILCDPMDCSSPSSSVHGVSQAKILEWVAISFSKKYDLLNRPAEAHSRQIAPEAAPLADLVP